MGAIIKFILIFIIVLYLIKKVGRFFYELFASPSDEKKQFNRKKASRKVNQEGDIHFQGERPEKNKKFKAGDYVDFEEVD